MVLRKQNIDVPFTGGLNQKVSNKLLKPSEMRKLENGRYLKNGRIDKRYGYTNLGQDVNTGTLASPSVLLSSGNELLMGSEDYLYSYSAADSTWYRKGELSIGRAAIEQISGSPVSASNVDVISNNGIRVAVWKETNYHYAVYDESTGSSIIPKATISAAQKNPRLVKTSNDIFILYGDSGTNIQFTRIPLSNPDSASSGSFINDLHANGAFDCIGLDANIFVFHRVSGTGDSKISRIDVDTLSVDLSQTISGAGPASAAEIGMSTYCVTSLAKDQIAVAYTTSASNVLAFQAWDVSLTTTFGAVGLLGSGLNVAYPIISPADDDASEVHVMYTRIDSPATNSWVNRQTVGATTGSAISAGVVMRSVQITSKGIYRNGTTYFNVVHSSSLQPTYFTITQGGKVVSKYTAGQGGDDTVQERVSNFSLTSTSNLYVCGVLKKGRIISGDGTDLYAVLNPYFGTLDLSGAQAITTTEVNNNLLIGGGILRSYDGQSATEYGFHLYPEDVSIAEATGGSIPTTTGPYLIQVVYEWTDARGVRFQSAPSIAQTITLTGSNNRIQVTVPSLRITDKNSDTSLTDRSAIKIRVFMSEASGTILHFATEVDNPDILTTDSVTINVDSVASPSAELLYTTGGVIENIAPPAHRYTFTHNNHIVLVGLENPLEVAISKDIKPLNGPGFNEDLLLRFDPLGGDCVAGASMDSYMIIFKETATYVVSGEAPNDLGVNSTFSAPQLVSPDIGCKDVKSIVQTPMGIMLKTNKGIRLLTRSLQYTYIGDKVEDYNSNTIVSADILKDTNEIRFVTDAGITLVYNYYFKRWCTFTTPNAVDATTWKSSEYVYLTSSKVMQEDSSTYLDDGSYVRTTIRTGWIRLGDLQGYLRAYRVALIGEYHTNHVFQVKQFYDYSDIVRGTTSITASSLVNTATYGESATYGDDSYYGGSDQDEVYQTRIHLARQKCESISFEIVDSIQGTNIGQGFSLEGLSVQVGGKNGIFKTSTTRTR